MICFYIGGQFGNNVTKANVVIHRESGLFEYIGMRLRRCAEIGEGAVSLLAGIDWVGGVLKIRRTLIRLNRTVGCKGTRW